MMITEVVLSIAWALCLGTVAQHAARRRGVDLRAAPVYWAATASIAGLAAATSCVTLTIDATLVVLVVAAVVDAQSGFIFDPLVIAGTVGVLIVAALAGGAGSSLYGGAVAGGALLFIWAITRGRGIGLGDVKLAAVVGAGFGPTGGISAVGLSFVVGAAVAIAGIIAGKAHFGSPVRFGPYLLAGSVCLLAYHRLFDGVIP